MARKLTKNPEESTDLFWQLIRGYCSEYIALEIFKELRKCGCITKVTMVRRNSLLDHEGVDMIVYAHGKKIPIQIKSSRPKHDEREKYLAKQIGIVVIGDLRLITIIEKINKELTNFNIRSIERRGITQVCREVAPSVNIERIRKHKIIRHTCVF